MKRDQYPEVIEYIVCAANRRHSDGLIVCSARHYDPVMRAMMDATGGSESWRGRLSEQGFINQWGDFLTREEALEIAKKTGQIRRRCGGDSDILFSENLY